MGAEKNLSHRLMGESVEPEIKEKAGDVQPVEFRVIQIPPEDPDIIRERYNLKAGGIGKRAVRKLITLSDGTQLIKRSTNKPDL